MWHSQRPEHGQRPTPCMAPSNRQQGNCRPHRQPHRLPTHTTHTHSGAQDRKQPWTGAQSHNAPSSSGCSVLEGRPQGSQHGIAAPQTGRLPSKRGLSQQPRWPQTPLSTTRARWNVSRVSVNEENPARHSPVQSTTHGSRGCIQQQACWSHSSHSSSTTHSARYSQSVGHYWRPWHRTHTHTYTHMDLHGLKPSATPSHFPAPTLLLRGTAPN